MTVPTPPIFTQRSHRFDDTTGALSWNYRSASLHPDRCVCQELETGEYAGTPHKHYDEPPHECARCECTGYRPALLPDLSCLNDLNILRPLDKETP